MTIDPIKAAIAPYMLAIKVGTVLVLAGSLSWCSYDAGRDKWKGKYTEAVASHKAVIKTQADNTKAAQDKAKAASKQAAADRKTNDKRYEDAQDEADKAKRDLAAALRAGTERLRDEWACPATGSGEGGAPGAASRQDANAGLRATGAADLIAAGDEADNWITWLQAEVVTTRQACGVTP